jgi:YVTN family beta-propeller protein
MPRSRIPRLVIAFALGLAVLPACTEKPTTPLDGGGIPLDGPYSATVQRIFNTSCTTSECHDASQPAAELQLTSWETFIAGSRYGEVIIAFRPEESHLIDHLTGVAQPRMPLSRSPLPPAQIDLIRRWIADGARNDAGRVPYADSRRKVYVTNQGSDKISVLDADAMVVIRILDVGSDAETEVPHNVHMDRQGRYFYVSLIRSSRVLKFDTAGDSLVGEAIVGRSPANPVASPDGRTVYVTNWTQDDPSLHVLDAETMLEKAAPIRFPAQFGSLAHGLCVTADGRTLYTTHEGAGTIARIELDAEGVPTGVIAPIWLGDAARPTRPLQVILDATESHAYVTCNGSGEVRVIDLATDEVAEVHAVGGNPWLEALSPDGRYVVVGNWGKDGVDVIDTTTQTVTSLTNGSFSRTVFARPHGVAFSGDGEFVFITNENTNGTFPQHHPTEGGGPNGVLTVLRAGTNELVKTLEVEVDPTGVAFVE